ncbi:AIF_collapsed_G0031730.mRNA.1.CDS.1 [Saccharomyces cerevisiae]|nr:AIF_collapsed_G0031730.mRNA.1.CDS.1 [Saccharomyces cerevisiae]
MLLMFVLLLQKVSNLKRKFWKVERNLDLNKQELINAAIRHGSYPKVLHFFNGPNYNENETIRHIEPALAFQLELGRLSNFNIKPIFTDNGNIHVYEAVSKTSPLDKRFFTRGIIRTGHIRDDILFKNI